MMKRSITFISLKLESRVTVISAEGTWAHDFVKLHLPLSCMYLKKLFMTPNEKGFFFLFEV